MKKLSTLPKRLIHHFVEALETRIAPAVFLVNTLTDSIAADGFVSLREAVSAANTNAVSGDAGAGDATGDVILFDETLFTNGTIVTAGGEYSITDDLQIFGRSTTGGAALGVTLDGDGLSRLFNINTTEAVSLVDLNLTDGFSTAANSGGAIFVNSGANLTLNNVDISSSDAAVSGGALFNNGGVVVISNSTFTGNAALGVAVTDGGGAIFNTAGSLTITNVDFVSNTATGGVANGGAIMSVGGTLIATGGSQITNAAARAGGAIEINGGTATLSGVSLGVVGFGNTTGINGGGLHISGAATVNISGGSVHDNTAGQEGGGLWNSSTGILNITSVSIMNNDANGNATEQGGGGVFSDGGTTRITTSTISGNTSTAMAVGNGGGGIFNDGTMIIVASTITNNTALNGSANGGGILNSGGATLTVLGGSISENDAVRAGGGIENNAGTVVLTNVKLNDNTTGINGGGLHTSGAGSVTINGGEVIGNVAGQEGGGVWNSTTGTMTIRPSAIQGTVISSNLANGNATEQGGGGVFNDGGTMNILGATIVNNEATAAAIGNGGGGIFNDGTMFVTDSFLFDNTASGASGNGGGILNSGAAQITITGTTIEGNFSSRAGGGIENNAGTVTITDSVFDDNFTGINGGGIHTSGLGTVNVTLSSFFNNEAGNEGGGLWNSSTGTMNITTTTIDGNEALFGGGVFGDGTGGTLSITSSTISFNVAGSFGGGVATEGGTLNIGNSTISTNHSASTRGGGVFILAGTVSISNSTIADNTAVGTAGGGIVIVAGTTTLTSTLVGNNTSDGTASDVVRDGGTLNAVNSLIESPASGVINGTDTQNILGVDPGLRVLDDNGGATLTHSLLPSSPAINTGSAAGTLLLDQRGTGFGRVVGLGADIGALELQGGVPTNSIYAIAAGKGDDVIVYDSATGNVLFNINAFNNSRTVTKGVTVATGDVTGDGVEDIIVGGSAGSEGARVKIFSGVTGTEVGSFFAYDDSFRGGVFVATGDVDGDGTAEIITGSGPGKITEPNVKVFTSTGVETGALIPFGDGFASGVRVAAGDVDGDGLADIVTTPGKGKSSPLVKVFDGGDGSLIQSFLAFPAARSQGVFVAAGDVDGDGVAEIITGLDSGKFGNEVRIYSGFGFGVPRLQIDAFPAFSTFFASSATGVRVGVADVNLDGIVDIILGSGSRSKPELSIVDGATGLEIRELLTLPADFKSGIFVG